MKNSVRIFFTLIILIAITVSCDQVSNDTIIIENDNVSDIADKYIEIQQKLMQSQAAIFMFRTNMGYKGFEGIKKAANKQKSFVADTSEYDWTCGEVSEGIDNDNYYFFSVDYGIEGCDDWGIWMKGKYTNRYFVTDSSLQLEDLFQNYSMENTEDSANYYFEINGYTKCNFTNMTPEEYLGDHEENFIMNYNDEIFSSQAIFKDAINNESYEILLGEATYKSSTQNYIYHTKILKKLVYSFNCGINTYTPISGREEINYTDNELSLNFTVDYGEGECDNIIMIYEQGQVFTINLDDYNNVGTDSTANLNLQTVFQ